MLAINQHRIAANAPVFTIAEAGVNHNGCVGTALQLVEAAKQAGADAVKFQMFTAKDLASASAPTASYQRRTAGVSSQRSLLESLQLSQQEFVIVKDHCENCGIVFLATPFGLPEIARLVDLGVHAIKIASTDLTNHLLLDRAIATGMPLILSTGASTREEIDTAVERLRNAGALERLVLLRCVSSYPTPTSALNLRAIGAMKKRYGVPCGLSDHTTSTLTGAWAVAAGACVVEKHLTLDTAARGPDHAMSMTPEGLAEYIARIREVEAALGDGEIGMADLECEVRSVARKSVVTTVTMAPGEYFTAESLTLKRPGTGIPPSDFDKLVGRKTTVAIPADTLLSWDMVQ